MLALTVNLLVLLMLLIRIASHCFKVNSLAVRASLDARQGKFSVRDHHHQQQQLYFGII